MQQNYEWNFKNVQKYISLYANMLIKGSTVVGWKESMNRVVWVWIRGLWSSLSDCSSSILEAARRSETDEQRRAEMTETDKQRRTAATSVWEEDKEKKGQTGRQWGKNKARKGHSIFYRKIHNLYSSRIQLMGKYSLNLFCFKSNISKCISRRGLM